MRGVDSSQRPAPVRSQGQKCVKSPLPIFGLVRLSNWCQVTLAQSATFLTVTVRSDPEDDGHLDAVWRLRDGRLTVMRLSGDHEVFAWAEHDGSPASSRHSPGSWIARCEHVRFWPALSAPPSSEFLTSRSDHLRWVADRWRGRRSPWRSPGSPRRWPRGRGRWHLWFGSSGSPAGCCGRSPLTRATAMPAQPLAPE